MNISEYNKFWSTPIGQPPIFLISLLFTEKTLPCASSNVSLAPNIEHEFNWDVLTTAP